MLARTAFAAICLLFAQVAFAAPHRAEVEAALPSLATKYQAAPGDAETARAYAQALFQLGDIWTAAQVMFPLAMETSRNLDDIAFGARIALAEGDYAKSERLFRRCLELSTKGSEARTKAVEGLVMTYYRTEQFDKVRDLSLPEETKPGAGETLAYMKRFKGQPYQIRWTTPDRTGHLAMVNDITPPGALPLFNFEINGHQVQFILDTGGDRMMIDEGVAKEVGIKTIYERQASYPYTKGQTVNELLGIAETVEIPGLTLSNVPVVVAKWKAMGIKNDGVITTGVLRQFLATVDYANKELTFRERSLAGRAQFLRAVGEKGVIQMPFFMTDTHLMFAHGSVNGHAGLNFYVDSGLAASMQMIIMEPTVDMLQIPKNMVQPNMFTVQLDSFGLGPLIQHNGQAIGNPMADDAPYRKNGFFFDALISHQYLRHLGSWTLDFDTMTYYFPVQQTQSAKD